MIHYDPRDWMSQLFEIRGSVIREIFGRVLLCGLWSAGVVAAENMTTKSVALPETGHALIGVALGLLLVLRTNASYDRYWEGRRQWGALVNASRNLARVASVYLAAAPALVDELLAWTTAFAWSSMYHLRGIRSVGDDTSGLPPAALEAVRATDRLPAAISRQMTGVVATGHRQQLISDIQQATLDQSIQALVDVCGACERIHNTPMPFAYVVHLRRALILYCVTLPFALVGRFGWVTVPAVMLIAYNLLGIEEIGVEIEDPFGRQNNDLPLEEICDTIQADLRTMRPALPHSSPAVAPSPSGGTGES